MKTCHLSIQKNVYSLVSAMGVLLSDQTVHLSSLLSVTSKAGRPYHAAFCWPFSSQTLALDTVAQLKWFIYVDIDQG